ncbi:MAG: NAD(+)/NADH kinase [Lachnospiraceae bacterium]|jgi:NAD+ kinase|nr:NAD(+)/NADH kinase [Lachnospiraceae bacterium]
MNRFFIISNPNKDPGGKIQREITDYLTSRGAIVQAAETDDGKAIRASRAECFIVLGGDGTMLQAARVTATGTAPLLGINLGNLGYLAEVDKSSWQSAADKLLADDFEVEERMMIDGRITTEAGKTGRTNCALNDVVIARRGSLRIVPYNVSINGRFLNGFEADGMIVATPTGSTGYNLSAGGPIVEPQAQLLVLTPICAHTMSPRSIIFSANDCIDIGIGTDHDGCRVEVEADFDGGRNARRMHSGDTIRIVRSDRTARIVKLSRISFLETLHRKMAE